MKNPIRMRTIAVAFAGASLLLGADALAGGCEGDVTGDGRTDFYDIVAVLTDYGCESDCSGDANGDGVVDFMDILTVIQNYGCGWAQCESQSDCDDGDPCTRDFCTPLGCVHIPTCG